MPLQLGYTTVSIQNELREELAYEKARLEMESGERVYTNDVIRYLLEQERQRRGDQRPVPPAHVEMPLPEALQDLDPAVIEALKEVVRQQNKTRYKRRRHS